MTGGTSPAPALNSTAAAEIIAPLSAQIATCPEDIRYGRGRTTCASSEPQPRVSAGLAAVADRAHAYPQVVAHPTSLQLALVGLTSPWSVEEQSTQLQLAALQLAASGSAAVLQLAALQLAAS